MKRSTTALLGIILLNVVVIAATELSGKWFREHGVIHGVAVLFVILALTRIPVLWRPFKEPAGRFVRWMLVALLVFAGAHAIEFIGYQLSGGRYTPALYANVGNMYMISMLAVIVGLEHILRTFYVRPRWFLRIPYAAITVVAILVVVFMFLGRGISMDSNALAPYIYTVVILGLGVFGFVNLLEVRRLQPALNSFARHMNYVFTLVIIAALINVLYNLLYDFLKIDRTHVIYLAHYSFYLGVSVMYLAFGEPVKSLAEQSSQ